MCVSDIRIARLATVSQTFYSSLAGTGLTYRPNRQRIGLIIKQSILWTAAQGCLITFSDGSVMSMTAYQSEFRATLMADGPICQLGFTISAILGFATGTVYETTLPEKYLSEPLDTFHSEQSRLGSKGYGG
jgi:hypothetical protein